MGKKQWIALLCMISMIILLAACGGNESAGEKDINPDKSEVSNNQKSDTQEPKKDDVKKVEPPKEISGKLDVWGGDYEYYDLFMKKYPKVQIEQNTPKGHEDATLVALAAGKGAPDVVALSQAHLLKFVAVQGLENLLAAPYNAGQYEKDFFPELWYDTQSLDGKRMVAFPVQYAPFMMLYRNDIFEENGLPSEPDDVDHFLSDPENFFDMAFKLRQRATSYSAALPK